MQEFQPMVPGGGGGGIFTASVPAEQRRLRAAAAAGYPAIAAISVAAPVKCPRCESSNTKFCYYNNYNLSQPRHFCKSCRRYWTKGGVLRNIPVGGGSRKSSSSSSSSSNNKRISSNRSTSSTAVGSNKNDRSISTTAAASASAATSTSIKPQIESIEQISCGERFEGIVVGPEIPLLGLSDHGGGIGDVFVSKIDGVHDWTTLMDPAAPFDLSGGGGDQGCYWNNHSHWEETDPALYIP